jgi:acyl carrier protein
MQDVIDILNQIRAGQEFTGVDNFFDRGVLDSLDLTALVSALESRYNIFFDVEEVVPENFRNLTAIGALLAKHGVTV